MSFGSLKLVHGLLGVMLALVALAGCESKPPAAGQKEFEAANSKINVYSNEIGFGGDEAATKLAKAFSEKVKKLEAESFEGGEKAEDSVTTKGNWLTYVHVAGDKLLVLVQVPHLDNYEGEDRKALAEVAWEAAQEALKAHADKEVTIGLRGKLLYGATAKGKLSGKPDIKTGTALEASQFYPLFAGGAAAAPAGSAAAK